MSRRCVESVRWERQSVPYDAGTSWRVYVTSPAAFTTSYASSIDLRSFLVDRLLHMRDHHACVAQMILQLVVLLVEGARECLLRFGDRCSFGRRSAEVGGSAFGDAPLCGVVVDHPLDEVVWFGAAAFDRPTVFPRGVPQPNGNPSQYRLSESAFAAIDSGSSSSGSSLQSRPKVPGRGSGLGASRRTYSEALVIVTRMLTSNTCISGANRHTSIHDTTTAIGPILKSSRLHRIPQHAWNIAIVIRECIVTLAAHTEFAAARSPVVSRRFRG